MLKSNISISQVSASTANYSSAMPSPPSPDLEDDMASLLQNPSDLPLLGEGGFGDIRLVRAGTLRRYSEQDLVLKLLPRTTQSDNRSTPRCLIQIAEQFQLERDILGQISHELSQLSDQNLRKIGETHVIKLVSSMTTPEYHGLLLSPVAPFNLHELLETDLTTEDDVVQIGKGKHPVDKKLITSWLHGYFAVLAAVVHCLHSMRIEHKDLTPKNILCGGFTSDGTIDKKGTLCLCDLGIAQRIAINEDELHAVTRGLSDGMYNPTWTSPERQRDSHKTAYKEDMYFLGLVFLEMQTVLNGRTLRDLDKFLNDRKMPKSEDLMSIPVREYQCKLETVAAWLTEIDAPNDMARTIQDLVCTT
jgi:serine/threonine protein kinase